MMEYLLFDLDGTLTDPKEGICKSVEHALHAFGIKVNSIDELEPFIGPPLTMSFKEFYGFDDENANKAVSIYRERYAVVGLYENEIYPGIADCLKKLHEMGKKLAVASSKPEVFVEKILKHFDIDTYFNVVVGSGLDGSRNTKEEVVEEALRRLGVLDDDEKKAHTAMIGDRKFDVEGAKAFGLTSIGVSFGYAPENELKEAMADYIVDTVSELFEICKN